MSMIARFVQVKPALLKTLLDDPASVESILEDEGAGAAPAAAMENMRKLLASRAPATSSTTRSGFLRTCKLCWALPERSSTTRVLSGPVHSRMARTSTACAGSSSSVDNSVTQAICDTRSLIAHEVNA